MKYTDNRGLIIPNEQIAELLDDVGKTEQEVREFLGADYVDLPGAFYYFVTGFASSKNWIISRKKS